MTDVRMYRLSTRYVYATVTSSTDPSSDPVWMAVKPVGTPAGDSDLHEAEWVPGETWTNGKRRARLLVGPESDLILDPGNYRVYYKTDLDPEVPFERDSYRLVVTSESGAVAPTTPELAAVAYSGAYEDLIGAPSASGVPITRQVIAGAGLTGGGDLSVDRTLTVQFGTAAGTAAQGNDARLSDARTPTAHTHPVGDVTGLGGILDTLNASVDDLEIAVADVPARLIVRTATVTSGNIPIPDTGAYPGGAWAVLTGAGELVLPAAVGDYVEASYNALREGVTNWGMDLATVKGATPTIHRYLSSDSTTPTAAGDPGQYPADGTFQGRPGVLGFTVTADDLDGAAVRVAVVVQSNGLGTRTLRASTGYPFHWVSKNHGPVD